MESEILKFIIKIIFEKNTNTAVTIFAIILLLSLLATLIITNVTDVVTKCVVGIIIFLLNIIVIYSIIKADTLPKADDKYKFSILFRINAKNKEEYEDMKLKLVETFQEIIQRQGEDIFSVVYIPYHLNDKYKDNSEEKIKRMLRKTKCVFLTTVKIKSEDLKQETKYVTTIDLGIVHPTYKEEIEKIFQREIDFVALNTRKLEYRSENKIQVLEATAIKLSYICRYIIGKAAYLNGELNIASSICDSLYEQVFKVKTNEKVINSLKNLLPRTCFTIHLVLSKIIYEQKIDDKYLEKADNEIEKANIYIKGTYEYHLNKSVYIFLKSRNIVAVKKELEECKKIINNGDWRYSDAFISAYQQESEIKICTKYIKAFKVEYELMYLIGFIESILELEEINSLRFALVMLELELGEESVAREVLKEYLDKKESHQLDEKSKRILASRYGNIFDII